MYENKILSPWRKETLGLLFLIGTLSAFLLSPFPSTSFPRHFDLLNHIVLIIQAKAALTAGQFPLRTSILHSLLELPYPTYQFYSPTSYTIAAMIDKWITAGNPFVAYSVTLWCAFIFSGMYMYALAKWFFKSKQAAVIASIVYLTTPYSLFVLHYFHGFNETLATCLIPAVLYYTLKRYYQCSNLKYFLPMAFVWYLLITIHLITFIYTTIFVGFFLILLTLKNTKLWKNFFNAFITYSFSLLLAIWFLAPVILLSNYFFMTSSFDSSELITKDAPTLSTIIGFKQLHNIFSHHTDLAPSLGWPILIGLVIILYAALSKKFQENTHLKHSVTLLFIIFSVAVFMVWSPFNFWQWVPSKLMVVQMTFRIYSQASWAGSLLVAAAYILLCRNRFNIKFFIITIVLLLISAYALLPTYDSNIPLSYFGENPKQVFNPGAYLLDAHRHPDLIKSIDSISLHTLEKNKLLQYDAEFVIPESLLALAYSPYISLTGNFLPGKHSHFQLNAVIDGKTIATKKISSDKFNWEIPLTLKLYEKNKSTMSLSFYVSSATNKFIKVTNIPIRVDTILLDGFLNPKEFLPLNKIMSDCHEEKAIIHCKINVPAKIRLLELPAYYYPQLLNITLNGKSIPYQSVHSDKAAIVGVIPEAGKINDFSVQFTGLVWANYISLGAWGCFAIMLLSFIRLPRKKQRTEQNSSQRLIVRIRLTPAFEK